MRSIALLTAFACLLLAAACAAADVPPTPVPTAVPTSTPSPTPPPTSTPAPSAAPTPTQDSRQSSEASDRSDAAGRDINVRRMGESPISSLHGTGEIEEFDGEAARLHQEAVAMIDRQEYAPAIAKLEAMIGVLDQPSFIVHNQLGMAYRWNRDHDNSIRHFGIAIDLNDTSVARTNRAMAYSYANRCPESVADASLALDMPLLESMTGLNPHLEALFLLIHCYTVLGENDVALDHISRAIELAESTGAGEARMASLGRVKQQIEGIAAGHAYPEDIMAGFALVDMNEGTRHLYGGDERRAIELFTSALEEHGRPSSRILSMLARSHASLGEDERAVDYFAQAIELRDSAFNRTWRALYYFGKEDCANAVLDVQEALVKKAFVEPGFHTRAESLWIKGVCSASQGDVRDALASMKEAINIARRSDYPQNYINAMETVYQQVLQAGSGQR